MTSPTPTLTACPHCGKTDTLILTTAEELANEGEDDPAPWEHSPSWAVICDASKPRGPGGCGAQGGFMPTEADAIAAWNRRSPTAPPDTLKQALYIAQLERALAECRDAAPIPAPGAPHEAHWSAAIGSPLDVPAYVRAAIASLQASLAAPPDTTGRVEVGVVAAAYLVEGFDANGKLYGKIAHFTVDEARNSAAEFVRHYSTVSTTPLVRAASTASSVGGVGSERAVMQQALDAMLAELDPGWQCESYHPKLWAAVKALREALAAPASPAPAGPSEPVAWHCDHGTVRCVVWSQERADEEAADGASVRALTWAAAAPSVVQGDGTVGGVAGTKPCCGFPVGGPCPDCPDVSPPPSAHEVQPAPSALGDGGKRNA